MEKLHDKDKKAINQIQVLGLKRSKEKTNDAESLKIK